MTCNTTRPPIRGGLNKPPVPHVTLSDVGPVVDALVNADFEGRVLPVVLEYTRLVKDPDVQANILSHAWYAHRTTRNRAELGAKCFLWYAKKRAYVGRTLPGMRPRSGYTQGGDAMDHIERDPSLEHQALGRKERDRPSNSNEDAMNHAQEGAKMSYYPDHRPGPARVAPMREQWGRLLARLTPKQRALADNSEMPTDRLAELLHVTPGRVSQLRREVERAYAMLDESA